MSKANFVRVRVLVAAVACVSMVAAAAADNFGSDGNQFTIDFVPISGATNPASGIPAGDGFTFTGVDHDYRMGELEITNDQWDKFKAALGVPVTGDPSGAYNNAPSWPGANLPTTGVSWYEAAQFVNWLNTSTGHQAAYKFTGVQGQSGYALDVWSAAEADGGVNLYRHRNAMYYLPTENEWVKAAYWNGSTLQTHATRPGESVHQGDGASGTGWNYYDRGYATNPAGPWAVGAGSLELNATFDMMGNVQEWMESPYSGAYDPQAQRGLRAGSYQYDGVTGGTLESTDRQRHRNPADEVNRVGFRVAADIPEPCSMLLLSLGGLMVSTSLRRRRS